MQNKKRFNNSSWLFLLVETLASIYQNKNITSLICSSSFPISMTLLYIFVCLTLCKSVSYNITGGWDSPSSTITIFSSTLVFYWEVAIKRHIAKFRCWGISTHNFDFSVSVSQFSTISLIAEIHQAVLLLMLVNLAREFQLDTQ